MSIVIRKPGILTTVQDLGRHGYRRYGINPGGVMDAAASLLSNAVLGNDEDATVIEMHYPAPQIEFEKETIAVIGGADLAPELDGKPLENWRPFYAARGSELRFTNKIMGNRAYLAVRGGVRCDKWLDSSSTNLAAKFGGFEGRKLMTNDRLEFESEKDFGAAGLNKKISPLLIPLYRPFPTVRIIAGAEFPNLDDNGKRLLLDQNFTISTNSDRMGFRLNGEPLNLARPREFISSAVNFGTIQILPDGQLIVLMADHQTAGGYPRIGHVITRDLSLIAQLGAKDKVAFHLVDVGHAEELALEFERDLSMLRAACRFPSVRK